MKIVENYPSNKDYLSSYLFQGLSGITLKTNLP